VLFVGSLLQAAGGSVEIFALRTQATNQLQDCKIQKTPKKTKARVEVDLQICMLEIKHSAGTTA